MPVPNAIGNFLRDELQDAVELWELCVFNPSCSTKYRRLGLDREYAECGLQKESQTATVVAVARAACGQADLFHLQGIRRGPLQKN
jgi:hypothetical protein